MEEEDVGKATTLGGPAPLQFLCTKPAASLLEDAVELVHPPTLAEVVDHTPMELANEGAKAFDVASASMAMLPPAPMHSASKPLEPTRKSSWKMAKSPVKVHVVSRIP